jgi:hypothetical protein
LFDIPGQVRKAINDTIWWITSTGLRPILEALGRTVLSTPDLAGNNRVQQLWTTSLTAANVIFVLFVVAAGIVVSARDTLQTQYGLKEILPRLAIAALAANLSLIICGKAIEATNALTKALAGQGVDGPTAAAAFSQTLYLTVNGTSFLGSLLGLAMLVMAIVVVITFIVRVGLLVVLIGVAPLALLCHALPQTEGLAQTWWRAFAACLGIQLGQAVLVVATVKVFLTPAGPTVLGVPATKDGLLGILVCLSMLWLLIKIPQWMRYLVLGQLGRRQGRGVVGQIIRAVVLVKTVGALGGIARGGRSRARVVTRGRRGPASTAPAVPAGRSARTVVPTARTASPRRATTAGTRTGHTRTTVPPAPVMFSDAPARQRPPVTPAGANGPVGFSHSPRPPRPRPVPPTQSSPYVRFSDATTAQRPRPIAPSRPPAGPAFSDAPQASSPGRGPQTPVPPVTFSAASPVARQREPAPHTRGASAAPNPGRRPTPRPTPPISRPKRQPPSP